MNVNIALLTVTDTRTFDNDKSGAILAEKIKEANHKLIDRKICKDNKEDIVLILLLSKNLLLFNNRIPAIVKITNNNISNNSFEIDNEAPKNAKGTDPTKQGKSRLRLKLPDLI